MAVGKTTLVKRLAHDYCCCLEDVNKIRNINLQVKNMHLNKNVKSDFAAIQKKFIQYEIDRFHSVDSSVCLFDGGLDAVKFYTLYYPLCIQKNWNIGEILSNELKVLDECLSDYIIYLDASHSVLKERKNKDVRRTRYSFNFSLSNLAEYRKEWYISQKNVFYLNVDKLNEDEVEHEVRKILRSLPI